MAPGSQTLDQTRDRLYRMRHSAAHIMAEAVLEMFPEAKFAIGPPIDNGFYYDFELPRAADARGSAGHRGAHAKPHQVGHRLRAQRDVEGRGAQAVRRPALQGRADRRHQPTRRSRSTSRARSSTSAKARTSTAPRRCRRSSSRASPARTGAATRSARCSSASTACMFETQAELDDYLERMEEAATPRPPQARPRARALHDERPGRLRAAAAAAEGRDHPPAARGVHARAGAGGGLPARLHAGSRARSSCTRPAGTGSTTATACTRRWRSNTKSWC